MEIYLDRNGTGKKSIDITTIGTLMVGGTSCLIIEDDYDDVKEYARTRIPAGRYKLRLRKFGRHHVKYKQWYPTFHKGMIELMNVPNYTDILIHRGVSAKDTAGCLCTGTTRVNENLISGSAKAYELIYPIIVEYIEKEETFINIKD